MTTWTLHTDSVNASFAALGLANLRITRLNMGIDTAAFDAPGAAFDSAPLLDYGDDVVIRKDSAVWFRGRCNTLPAMGDPVDERISYELVGPWWWLERIMYEQSWKHFIVNDEVLDDTYKSRVILCQNAAGNRWTSGEQIADAIAWAAEKGAPIQAGTIDPTMQIPWSEEIDITCAEVIHRMLRWAPDAVVYFDYSTDPPTMHVRSRANLAAVSFACAAGAPAHRLSVTPRYDLQVPGVLLRYEQRHTYENVIYEIIEEDEAGDTDDPRALKSTIELAGSSTSLLTQWLEIEALPEDLNIKSFWTSRIAWLNQFADEDLVIHSAERGLPEEDWPDYPNMLLKGNIHTWMTEYEQVVSADETLTAKANYIERDAAGEVVEIKRDVEISVKIVATNAETRWYRRIGQYDSGEPIPVGLAAAVYSAAGQLQYDGQYTLLQEEVASNAYPGKKLNLTGGRAAWAAMNAVIQQTTEDVDAGITHIGFGPVRALGPDQLIEMLRAFRNRKVSRRYSIRLNAESRDADGSVPLNYDAARADPSDGGGEYEKLVLQHYAGDPEAVDKSIVLDPDEAVSEGQALQFWTEDGVLKAKPGWLRFHS